MLLFASNDIHALSDARNIMYAFSMNNIKSILSSVVSSLDSHGKNTTHRCIAYPNLILSSFPGIPSSPIHKPLLQMLLCISCLHSQLLAQSTGSSIASAGHIKCSSRSNPYVITSDCIYVFLCDAFCKYHNVVLQCIRNDKLLMRHIWSGR